MKSRTLLPLAITAAALVALAAGCGSTDVATTTTSGGGQSTTAVKRQAAAFVPDTKTCPERHSWTLEPIVIWNYLNYPVRVRAGDYICNDWSGVSTPGHVFNNVVVDTRSSFKSAQLEPADNVERNWTMEFSNANTGEQLATVRMAVRVQAAEIGMPEVWTKRLTCQYLKTDFPIYYTTGDYVWPQSRNVLALVGYEGRLTIVTHCGGGGPMPE